MWKRSNPNRLTSLCVGGLYFDHGHVQVQVELCRSSESLQQEYEYSCSLFAMTTANWSDTEVLHLIELWGEEGIQQQLEEAKRNKHVYEKLTRELQKTGK